MVSLRVTKPLRSPRSSQRIPELDNLQWLLNPCRLKLSRLLTKKDRIRIDTSGDSAFGSDAFGSLSLEGLPAGPEPKKVSSEPSQRGLNATRLEVRREKSGRAGKTVTAIYGVSVFSEEEITSLLKKLKKRLATGGTITSAGIEIQGDFADQVMDALKGFGYRAVRTGG